MAKIENRIWREDYLVLVKSILLHGQIILLLNVLESVGSSLEIGLIIPDLVFCNWKPEGSEVWFSKINVYVTKLQ